MDKTQSSAAKQRRVFTDEFKQDAVRLGELKGTRTVSRFHRRGRKLAMGIMV